MRPPPSIGVIHTSPATVELFGKLIGNRLPGARIVNFLDDSILPELRDNGGDVRAVEPRWRSYALIMSERNVDVILNACSSIGELGSRVQPEIRQPIVRVDAGMARAAVSIGSSITILATLGSTLGPTSQLIRETARSSGYSGRLESILIEGAYHALVAGDQTQHDDLVAAALEKAVQASDVVVLAQASMARVLPRLEEGQRVRVLASPSYAVDDIVEQLTAVAKLT
jgi:Asp/Glu/hydantoin racemase